MRPGERRDYSRHLCLSLLHFYYNYRRLVHRLVVRQVRRRPLDTIAILTLLTRPRLRRTNTLCHPHPLHQCPETTNCRVFSIREVLTEAYIRQDIRTALGPGRRR
jgi:hypothetical protein